MNPKSAVKKLLFGTGPRPARVHAGLLRGLTIESDAGVDTQQLTGLYEREILRPVRRFAARACTALDIGAGEGYYTLYFASVPGIRNVIACEPDSKRLRLLRHNLALNRGFDVKKVSVREVSVGSGGRATLDLETLLKDSIDPILLKIDVEGAEMDVLKSGAESIAKRDLMLVIETHSAALEQECIGFLERNGYECGIRKHGWYRRLVPELRHMPHNRWLIADRIGHA